MSLPNWAIPRNDMSAEECRFAVAAQDIIEFKRKGFTRSQHLACFKPSYRAQAAKDWDEIERRQHPVSHKLRLTPGHQNTHGEFEKPWQCDVCKLYFNRHTKAKTCKGSPILDAGLNRDVTVIYNAGE